ncbi:MAG: hypothetical protein U9P14_08530, partial [Gemmatimonadota bacterium]|nr:hypothetical protein [Gemmatimonadota bacterium]
LQAAMRINISARAVGLQSTGSSKTVPEKHASAADGGQYGADRQNAAPVNNVWSPTLHRPRLRSVLKNNHQAGK